MTIFTEGSGPIHDLTTLLFPSGRDRVLQSCARTLNSTVS